MTLPMQKCQAKIANSTTEWKSIYVRLCIECGDLFFVSMVFSKDIFSAIYKEYIKGFVPIRYRGYCLCISPHLILIYLQARVFQKFSSVAYPAIGSNT
jgi:hypothetical protein